MRICQWCSAPLNERQIVACSTRCRLRRWRWLNGVPRAEGVAPERPPTGSLLWAGSAPQPLAPRRSNGSARVSNGGLQVSVGRMLQVLQEGPWVLPEVQARRAIARALPERQRARFDHTPDPAMPGQLDLEGREAA